MNDRPYTDADLRAEAARQLFGSQQDPDFMGVGEQMTNAVIESTVTDPDAESGPEAGRTWDMLAHADFNTAQQKIDDLLGYAADLSDWSVALGADGLEPDAHLFEVKAGDKIIVRLHFAFDPDLPDDARDAFVTGIGQAVVDGI